MKHTIEIFCFLLLQLQFQHRKIIQFHCLSFAPFPFLRFKRIFFSFLFVMSSRIDTRYFNHIPEYLNIWWKYFNGIAIAYRNCNWNGRQIRFSEISFGSWGKWNEIAISNQVFNLNTANTPAQCSFHRMIRLSYFQLLKIKENL